MSSMTTSAPRRRRSACRRGASWRGPPSAMCDAHVADDQPELRVRRRADAARRVLDRHAPRRRQSPPPPTYEAARVDVGRGLKRAAEVRLARVDVHRRSGSTAAPRRRGSARAASRRRRDHNGVPPRGARPARWRVRRRPRGERKPGVGVGLLRQERRLRAAGGKQLGQRREAEAQPRIHRRGDRRASIALADRLREGGFDAGEAGERPASTSSHMNSNALPALPPRTQRAPCRAPRRLPPRRRARDVRREPQKATSIAGDSVSPSVPSKSKRTPTWASRTCGYPGGAYWPSVAVI